MIKYPSIGQFKNTIQEVARKTRFVGIEDGVPVYNNNPLPTLTFTGSPKLHGTNSGIRYEKNGTLTPQSRERDLSLLSDNHGFAAYVLKNADFWKTVCSEIINRDDDNDYVVIFGEWAGSGIQAKVAVSQLPKRFYIFGIEFIKEGRRDIWVDYEDLNKYVPECINEKVDAYTISQFPNWTIDIDFNSPELVQNKLIELTEEVENECPVGKYFGVSSIGEGIVWSHTSEFGHYQFKVKGEKHQNSKVKTLAPIDEQAYALAREFAETFVTESRLEQGVFVMKNEMQLDIDIKNLGVFIKWVVGDVMKEESNAMLQSDLNPKKVAQEISKLARNWFLRKF